MICDIVLLVRAFLICIYCHGVSGETDCRNDLFKAKSSLDGYECSGSLAVTSDLSTKTMIQCADMCEEHFECIGFYYQSDDDKCQLCNYLFKAAAINSLVAMAGSKYFGRTDCNGRVHGRKDLSVFLENKNYDDAHARCLVIGGTLMRIRDLVDRDQIADALMTCSSYNTASNYWTDGILDVLYTGTWKYSDGTLMPMEADYWDIGGPDMNKPCVRLFYVTEVDSYRWNDYGCENLYRFVCEIE